MERLWYLAFVDQAPKKDQLREWLRGWSFAV